VWGAVSGAGGAAGVLLGGVLTQARGWPWIFYAVATGAFLVLAAVAGCVARTPVEESGRFDLLGTATATLALTTLVWGLTSARRSGWADAQILGAFALAAVLLAAFVLIERRHPDPLLPPPPSRAIVGCTDRSSCDAPSAAILFASTHPVLRSRSAKGRAASMIFSPSAVSCIGWARCARMSTWPRGPSPGAGTGP
jgi:hypothetical protein